MYDVQDFGHVIAVGDKTQTDAVGRFSNHRNPLLQKTSEDLSEKSVDLSDVLSDNRDLRLLVDHLHFRESGSWAAT